MRTLLQFWMDTSPSLDNGKLVKPPPEGFDNIEARARPLTMVSPEGRTRGDVHFHEIGELRHQGWRLVFTKWAKLVIVYSYIVQSYET